MIKSDLMKFFKLALPAMFGIFMLTSNTSGAEMTTDNWDKIFAKSDKVDVKKVTLKNRYGITLAGDLYIPAGREGGKLPAIAGLTAGQRT